jgi:hypothetical protein
MDTHGIHARPYETTNTLPPDAPILDAWERRKSAYERLDGLALLECPGIGHVSPEEQDCLHTIDCAEILIRSNIAHTPAGIATQIWCSLSHFPDLSRAEQTATIRGDLVQLAAIEAGLDWNAQLAVAALRSLKMMEAN